MFNWINIVDEDKKPQKETKKENKGMKCGRCLSHIKAGREFYCNNEESDNYGYETAYSDSCDKCQCQ